MNISFVLWLSCSQIDNDVVVVWDSITKIGVVGDATNVKVCSHAYHLSSVDAVPPWLVGSGNGPRLLCLPFFISLIYEYEFTKMASCTHRSFREVAAALCGLLSSPVQQLALWPA